MPKYNECSIYEEACRNGTCAHQNGPNNSQAMDIEEYANAEVTATMSFEVYTELAAFLAGSWVPAVLRDHFKGIKFVRTR